MKVLLFFVISFAVTKLIDRNMMARIRQENSAYRFQTKVSTKSNYKHHFNGVNFRKSRKLGNKDHPLIRYRISKPDLNAFPMQIFCQVHKSQVPLNANFPKFKESAAANNFISSYVLDRKEQKQRALLNILSNYGKVLMP